jgi:hypothetical protein
MLFIVLFHEENLRPISRLVSTSGSVLHSNGHTSKLRAIGPQPRGLLPSTTSLIFTHSRKNIYITETKQTNIYLRPTTYHLPSHTKYQLITNKSRIIIFCLEFTFIYLCSPYTQYTSTLLLHYHNTM